MSESIETKADFLPVAVGVAISVVFIIIDYFLLTNFLSIFGLLLASLIAGFLCKKPILYSIIYGALIGLIISLILQGLTGYYPTWPELIGKAIAGAVIGKFVSSKIM